MNVVLPAGSECHVAHVTKIQSEIKIRSFTVEVMNTVSGGATLFTGRIYVTPG